jgi:site-specific DNA recombinase
MDGDKRIVLPNAAPALVTTTMAKEVQKRLEENKRAAARNNKDPERGLLRAGYVKCGLCGSGLIMKPYSHEGTKGTVRAYTYYCRRRRLPRADINHCSGVQMAVHVLDKQVWEHVLRFLRDPLGVAVEASRRPEQHRQEDLLEGYRKELKALERREANVRKAIQLIEDDAVAGLVDDLKSLAARKAQVREEIERLEDERTGRVNTQARIEAVQLWVNELERKHVDFTYLEKRATLYGCNVCVTVFPSGEGPRYKVVAGRNGEVTLFDGSRPIRSESGDCTYAL